MRTIKLSLVFVASLWLAACAPAPQPEPHILYFTQRTDAQAGLLAPGQMQQTLGAQPTAEWGDLLVLHSAQPASAILIDGAAAGQAAPDDLADLYRQCVVLVFFNVYAPDIARLVNDVSIAAEGWMDGSDAYPGDFYILVHRTVSGSQGDCSGAGPSGPPGATGGMGKSRLQGQLATQADVDTFQGVLKLQLTER